jgi:hypothetical protein
MLLVIYYLYDTTRYLILTALQRSWPPHTCLPLRSCWSAVTAPTPAPATLAPSSALCVPPRSCSPRCSWLSNTLHLHRNRHQQFQDMTMHTYLVDSTCSDKHSSYGQMQCMSTKAGTHLGSSLSPPPLPPLHMPLFCSHLPLCHLYTCTCRPSPAQTSITPTGFSLVVASVFL